MADIDALAARVAAGSHPVRWNESNPAVRRFFTTDPFGNRIALVQAKGEA